MKQNLALIGLLALFVSACGTLFQKADEQGNIPPAPGATLTNLVLAPEYQTPLETVRDSGLPYVSEAAGLALAIISGYLGIRNRRLKRTASILTRNIDTLNPIGDALETIKAEQESAGVREEVRSLLK